MAKIGRWPVIAWSLVPAYGYGDETGIIPVALGIVFNADVHAVSLPMGHAAWQRQVARHGFGRMPRHGPTLQRCYGDGRLACGR